MVGVAVSRMKYVHWPSTGFSSRSSQLWNSLALILKWRVQSSGGELLHF